MELLKSRYPIISTALFGALIVVAHLFSSDNYNWTKNTISELGAQGYDRKRIMQIGFLAFGLMLAWGIMLNGLTWRRLPILIYGLSVALTGVFCTKPFFDVETYSTLQSTVHSILAQIAGVAFSVGILAQFFFAANKHLKYMHLLFFVLVIGFSATFGLLNDYQGLAQRLLYFVSFIWLMSYYKP